MRRALGRVTFLRDDLPAAEFATIEPAVNAPAPAVSVIIATYNRSNVLAHTLRSVVGQTFTDWECLVVGDACTDDTEEVVARFADPRIRFINLATNMGDQSGPNSVGARLARGIFIAWLNHDDLLFPDHLEYRLAMLERTGADATVGGAYLLRSISRETDGRLVGSLVNQQWAERFSYAIGEFHTASTWVLRRTLVDKLGDWRSAWAVRGSSSQDYLYRCWSAGADVRVADRNSVIIVPSTLADGAYSTRRDREQGLLAPIAAAGNREALDRLVAPGVSTRFRVTESIAATGAALTPWRRWLRARSDFLFPRTYRLAARFGMSPWEYAAALVGLDPGDTNLVLRHFRGFEQLGS